MSRLLLHHHHHYRQNCLVGDSIQDCKNYFFFKTHLLLASYKIRKTTTSGLVCDCGEHMIVPISGICQNQGLVSVVGPQQKSSRSTLLADRNSTTLQLAAVHFKREMMLVSSASATTLCSTRVTDTTSWTN